MQSHQIKKLLPWMKALSDAICLKAMSLPLSADQLRIRYPWFWFWKLFTFIYGCTKLHYLPCFSSDECFKVYRFGLRMPSGMYGFHSHIHSYIYSTTKHEILQISNHNLLCSLDPPNQGWLFWVIGLEVN